MNSIKLFIAAFATALMIALAHMGLTPSKAVVGSRTIVTLRISHDCGDDTIGTTNFTVVLPPRLPSVRVEYGNDWRVFIHKAVADPPIDTGHGFIDTYVHNITYIGFLPDGFYKLFNLRITFPKTISEPLWFKGYQDCHNQGTSIAWDAIPSKEHPKPTYPARSITLVNSTEHL